MKYVEFPGKKTAYIWTSGTEMSQGKHISRRVDHVEK